MSNNNGFDRFRANQNTGTFNRLTLSDQLDLIYNENNNLKSYIQEQDYHREEITKSFEDKICLLEYEKSVIIQETTNNYKLYEERINDLSNEVFKLKMLLKTSNEQKETIQEDYHKLEERYRVANEYIKVLPTPQESDRLNNNLSNLKKSNEHYKSQLHETYTVIKKLENELSRKKAELANSYDRTVIMKSQMEVLSEKLCNVNLTRNIKQEYKEDWSSPPDLLDDMKMTLERYKTELKHSNQIIESEKKKFEQLNVDYQRQMDDLQKQLDSESETVATLRREIEQKQFQFYDLEQKLKSAAHQKQDILGNMMDLQLEIDRLDNFGSDKLQILFDKLLSEIVLCIGDIEIVSQSLWKLANKEEIDISELLGSLSMETLTLAEPNSRLLNKEFFEHQLDKVKQSRERISHIRNSVTQFYTNKMTSDLKFCITQ